MDDSNAIDIVSSTSSKRFIDLAERKMDVLYQLTTYTGERDVYEVCTVHNVMMTNVSSASFSAMILTEHNSFSPMEVNR